MNTQKFIIDGKEVGVEKIPDGAIISAVNEGGPNCQECRIFGIKRENELHQDTAYLGDDGWPLLYLPDIQIHSIPGMRKMWMAGEGFEPSVFYDKPEKDGELTADDNPFEQWIGVVYKENYDSDIVMELEDEPRECWEPV